MFEAKKLTLIEQYTEDKYTIEELAKMCFEKMMNSQKDGVIVEFVSQKPVYNDKREVVGLTLSFPAELNVYRMAY